MSPFWTLPLLKLIWGNQRPAKNGTRVRASVQVKLNHSDPFQESVYLNLFVNGRKLVVDRRVYQYLPSDSHRLNHSSGVT
jgi:hypothetical protein